jgi:tRNA_anti-like
LKEVGFFGADKKLGVSLDGGFQGGMDFLVNAPIDPADHAKVYRLSKGQEIKIVGVFKGAFGRFVSLDSGPLTEVTPSKIIEIKSTDLAADYVDDAPGADRKYASQTLLVTGQVVEAKKGADGRPYAKLKSGPRLAVRVHANALGSLEADKLETGKTAVIRVDRLSFDPVMNELSLREIAVAEVK